MYASFIITIQLKLYVLIHQQASYDCEQTEGNTVKYTDAEY